MRKLLLVATLCFAALVGCQFLEGVGVRATETRSDGSNAAGVLLTNVPTVAGNPLDFGAWGEIVKALGYLLLGAGGKVGADKLVARRKAA